MNIEAWRLLAINLAQAMEKSVDVGCTDHLDCWGEAEEVWNEPLERIRKFLAEEVGSDTPVAHS